MYQTYTRIPLLLIIAAILLTQPGCMAAYDAVAAPMYVETLREGATLHLVASAKELQPGTTAFVNGNVTILARAMDRAWQFVIIDTTNGRFIRDLSRVNLQGQVVNCNTFSDFANWLKNNGWKEVSTLPPSVKIVLDKATTAGQLLQSMRGSLMSFLVLPVGVLPVDILPADITH